jgi:hypothetical protein
VRIHEASHAVAALACGIPIRAVEVDGYCRSGFCDTDMTRSSPVADRLTIFYAGQAGERRFWPQYEPGGRNDLQRARDLALREAGSGAEQMLDAARRRAEQIVEMHWPAIEALAARLKDCGGTLSGSEATAIVKLGANTLLPDLTTRVLNRNAQLSANVGSAVDDHDKGTMNVLASGKVIGEIVQRTRGGYDAFRLVRGDLKRVGRFSDAASAARAV